ncbi:MAG: hypothetical protein SFW36_09865, partial [Leptolyngbyaceae cyanobacterium bins.59]|nr:hypothetical protein [Leptolyngbyaceae cyanobacterium bins.59]
MTQVVHSPENSAQKLVVRLLLAMLLVSCQRTPLPDVSNNLNAPPRLKPLPQDAFVEAYFNQSPASQYTEPYRQQVRFGDDLEQKIVETIAAAQSSLIVAVQELRSPKIAWALAERHKAGVRVKVIIENTYARPWSSFTLPELEKMSKRDRGRYQ